MNCNYFSRFKHNHTGIKIYFLLLLLLPGSFIYSQNPDINMLRNINLDRNRNLDGIFLGITRSVTPVATGAPVILLGEGLIKKDTVMVKNSILLAASVLTSVVISSALKYSIERERPFITYPELERMTHAGSPSFPSGHTSDAFALATSLSLSYPEWYVIAPSFAWAVAVGYSRMHLGVHYPSDVLAGAITGAGSAYLSCKARQWLAKGDRR